MEKRSESDEVLKHIDSEEAPGHPSESQDATTSRMDRPRLWAEYLKHVRNEQENSREQQKKIGDKKETEEFLSTAQQFLQPQQTKQQIQQVLSGSQQQQQWVGEEHRVLPQQEELQWQQQYPQQQQTSMYAAMRENQFLKSQTQEQGLEQYQLHWQPQQEMPHQQLPASQEVTPGYITDEFLEYPHFQGAWSDSYNLDTLRDWESETVIERPHMIRGAREIVGSFPENSLGENEYLNLEIQDQGLSGLGQQQQLQQQQQHDRLQQHLHQLPGTQQSLQDRQQLHQLHEPHQLPANQEVTPGYITDGFLEYPHLQGAWSDSYNLDALREWKTETVIEHPHMIQGAREIVGPFPENSLGENEYLNLEIQDQGLSGLGQQQQLQQQQQHQQQHDRSEQHLHQLPGTQQSLQDRQQLHQLHEPHQLPANITDEFLEYLHLQGAWSDSYNLDALREWKTETVIEHPHMIQGAREIVGPFPENSLGENEYLNLEIQDQGLSGLGQQQQLQQQQQHDRLQQHLHQLPGTQQSLQDRQQLHQLHEPHQLPANQEVTPGYITDGFLEYPHLQGAWSDSYNLDALRDWKTETVIEHPHMLQGAREIVGPFPENSLGENEYPNLEIQDQGLSGLGQQQQLQQQQQHQQQHDRSEQHLHQLPGTQQSLQDRQQLHQLHEPHQLPANITDEFLEYLHLQGAWSDSYNLDALREWKTETVIEHPHMIHGAREIVGPFPENSLGENEYLNLEIQDQGLSGLGQQQQLQQQQHQQQHDRSEQHLHQLPGTQQSLQDRQQLHQHHQTQQHAPAGNINLNTVREALGPERFGLFELLRANWKEKILSSDDFMACIEDLFTEQPQLLQAVAEIVYREP